MSKTNFSVTRAQVAEHISYNPDSGEVSYVSSGFKRMAGDIVPPSQNVINILGSSYSKLKLIWFIQTGSWPDGKVNSKDIGCGDTRWESLASRMGAVRASITQDRLQDLLAYNQDSGVFTWKISTSSSAIKGDVAGCDNKAGYIVIRIDGELFLAHRLAFLFMTSKMPPDMVDHIDGVKSNNRWENLRPANQSENQQNRRKAQSNNDSSGLLGVYWSSKNESWGAKVVLNRIQYHAGYHQTPEDAHKAYIAKKIAIHPYGNLAQS